MKQTAKIFINGHSQAVRLPKEYRFNTNEVYISKQGDSIVLTEKKLSWDDFFDEKSNFEDDFLNDREDASPQENNK